MAGLALARCATPKVGRRSTYTIFAFAGYFIACMFAMVLALHWRFTLGMRLVALVAPPFAFVVVAIVATTIKGREWLVFFQSTTAGVIAVVLLGLAIDAPVWRLLDCAVLGIGALLVFGRLGCFHVACCYGRPARRGVIYDQRYANVGFWRRWIGRPLVPVQLLESAGSALLVVLALSCSAVPGNAALAFGIGYSVLRFVLELWRGDPIRPFAYGVSEAQWFSLLTLAACGIARPTWWTLIPALGVALVAAVLVARRKQRELLLPPHLLAIDAACEAILADPTHAKRDTALGVSVSYHPLPDGRRDWIVSSTHPHWNTRTARRLAELLWIEPEIVEGRTSGLVHVLVSSESTT